MAIKHNELMALSATSMDPEMIILSEGSQIEKDKEPRISLMGRIEKSVQMNSETDSQTWKSNFWSPKGKGVVEGGIS